MTSPIVAPSPPVSETEPLHLAESRALYERGLYLQAHRRATAHAPLREWAGSVAERLFAGRLLSNVGSPRAARWHAHHAFRTNPRHGEAAYYFGRTVLALRGPWACLQFLDAQPELEWPRAPHRADWLLLRARAFAHLRDYGSMDRWFAEAEAIAPDRPWLWVERSAFFEMQDRLDEALEAARVSRSLEPWYRPGLERLADVLEALGRDEEAVTLLEQADSQLESAGIATRLAMYYRELGQPDRARAAWERVQLLSPELDAKTFSWLAAHRSWAEYLAGNLERARELTALAADPYHRRMLPRLESATAIDRKVLDVPFVRQHHMTCAPATLASLGQFWAMATDHLTVAADICYDGTPAASERKWAEDNGWAVREFTVDWDTTVALIDRGVPFTFTTTETASSHLQGIVGYDRTRRTLLVRDPSSRALGELDADAAFERYAYTGPRGMALVPLAERPRLEGLVLPDAELYDELYAVERALRDHDRARAKERVDRMVARDADHRLTIDAIYSLANYDQDPREQLRCAERMLARYPKQPRLVLWNLSCLRNLSRWDERISKLRDAVRDGAKEPLYWLHHAEELVADQRTHDEADFLLRRAMRHRPLTAGAYRALADLRWSQDRKPESIELYRLASCLEEKNESLASTYFSSARLAGDVSSALAFLEDRFERFGGQAPWPAQTLAWAYGQLERGNDARRALDRAMALRPADGELALSAADAALRAGDDARALELLRSAEGKVRREAYLRAAASIAWHRIDLAGALAHHREILAIAPLAMDSHRAVSELLASTAGERASVEHLRAAIERFPHHEPLHELYLAYEKGHDVGRALAVLDRLIAAHPNNAWNLRERALLLARAQRHDEALRDLRAAAELEPRSPYQHSVGGCIHETAGRLAEAREAYRESTRINVDLLVAWPSLLELAQADDAWAAELDFVAGELARQRLVSGEGLLAFLPRAQRVWKPEALTAFVRERFAARPELWAVWAALIRQLLEIEQLDEALDVAKRATARFPLLPALWVDLSRVHEARDERIARIAALEEALKLNPSYGHAARTLAAAHGEHGNRDQMKAVLQRAVHSAPLDPRNHDCLADCLWDRDEKKEALEALMSALRVDGSNDEAWDRLARWSREAGLREDAIAFARTLTQTHAGRAESWFGLARLLDDSEERDERLSAVNQALAVSPRWAEAHDLKIVTLSEAGRHDEAERAAHPEVFGAEPPIGVQARAAWVIAQRGDLSGAIRAMEAVLARAPSNTWALTRIIDWATEQKEYATALQWARRLHDVEPDAPRSYGYLGDALRLTGERDAAKDAFRRARAGAPDYTFAGWSLFELLLADGELTEAQQVLQGLAEHVSAPELLEARIRWELRAGDRSEARETFARLCALPDAARGLIESACAKLSEAGMQREVASVLDEAVRTAHASEALGALWLTVRADEATTPFVWGTMSSMPSVSARTAALSAYLERLAERNQLRTLWWFLLFYRSRLRREATSVWGMVGYALVKLEQYAEAQQWLGREWRARAEVLPWMLSNLVVATSVTGALGLRREASAHALSLAPDHTRSLHLLWAAFDAATRGEGRLAEEHLAEVPEAPEKGTKYFLFHLARILAKAQRGADDRSSWVEARKAFAALWNEGLYTSVLGRSLGRDAAWALRQGRGPSGWLWWLAVRAQIALSSPLP